MKSLGIIPARIGSSGVKKKNIRLLDGHPLISYTIKQALASGLSKVMVSTDSEEIAEIARDYGAEVPFIRPQNLAENETKAILVVAHCLDWLTANDSFSADAVMYLQPTSPFRTSEQIDSSLALLKDSSRDTVISVTRVKEHPYYMFQPAQGDDIEEYVKLENKPERRQDLPALYMLNDSIMLSTIDYLRSVIPEQGLVTSLSSFKPLYIDEQSAIDINTESDFLLADILMQHRH
jgi:CMP-N-acetylneuraminic acid synthetase